MEKLIRFAPGMDPSVAKLRYKISEMMFMYGIDRYEDECLEFIMDYLVIYMKTVIRRMAEYKIKYKITLPIPEKKYQKRNIGGKVAERNKIEQRGMCAYEVKKDETCIEKNNENKSINIDDEKEHMEVDNTERMEVAYLSSKEERDRNNYISTPQNKYTHTYIYRKCVMEKNNKVKGVKPKTEVIYSQGPFSLKDFIGLLKMSPQVIPQNSLFQIIMARTLSKLNKN